jgi:hypothetical protein
MSSHGHLIVYGGEMLIKTTKIDHKKKNTRSNLCLAPSRNADWPWFVIV